LNPRVSPTCPSPFNSPLRVSGESERIVAELNQAANSKRMNSVLIPYVEV